MPFSPTLAAIRFGCGLSPTIAPPASATEMVRALGRPDEIARRFPIQQFANLSPALDEIPRANQALSAARGTNRESQAQEHVQAISRRTKVARNTDALATIARGVDAPDALRERLTWFWANHFTVVSRMPSLNHVVHAYIEEAIRPHVTGRFGDMLKAAIIHPAMIYYLDQHRSVGPNSVAGKRRDDLGMNENLARELLELHTLGVDGAYSQTDVREMAQLLTGLRFDLERGFWFEERWSEPGSETVMGRTYGADKSMAPIFAALDDLAVHPDTAQHLCGKLVSHFISDIPDPAFVSSLANVYLGSGGNLHEVMGAMLLDERAWSPKRQKVKLPFEFIVASLRALGVTGRQVMASESKDFSQTIIHPMRVMAQPYQKPTGPDGWDDTSANWVFPQGVAGRITWAMSMPQRYVDPLPDPRAFVTTALGSDAPRAVRFAAEAAETRAEGVGMVLASPAFQRR